MSERESRPSSLVCTPEWKIGYEAGWKAAESYHAAALDLEKNCGICREPLDQCKGGDLPPVGVGSRCTPPDSSAADCTCPNRDTLVGNCLVHGDGLGRKWKFAPDAHEEGEPETIREPMPVSPEVAEAFPVPAWRPASGDMELNAIAATLGGALANADDLLRRLSEWDALNVAPYAGDRDFWIGEIANARTLNRLALQRCAQAGSGSHTHDDPEVAS